MTLDIRIKISWEVRCIIPSSKSEIGVIILVQ